MWLLPNDNKYLHSKTKEEKWVSTNDTKKKKEDKKKGGHKNIPVKYRSLATSTTASPAVILSTLVSTMISTTKVRTVRTFFFCIGFSKFLQLISYGRGAGRTFQFLQLSASANDALRWGLTFAAKLAVWFVMKLDILRYHDHLETNYQK